MFDTALVTSALLDPNFVQNSKGRYAELIATITLHYPNVPIREALYRIAHDLPDGGACTVCGGEVAFRGPVKGYDRFCCRDCRTISELGVELADDLESKEFIARLLLAYRKRNTFGGFRGVEKALPYYTQLVIEGCGWEGCSVEESAWLYLYGDTSACKVCGESASFVSLEAGYLDYCSPACGSVGTVKVREDYFLEEYGVSNPSQLQSVKDRKVETTRKNYGVDNPFQSEEVKQRIRRTLLDRYGVEHFSRTDEFKAKCQAAWLANWGVTNPLKSPEILAKVQQTNMERYGGVSSSSSPEVIAARIATFMERYGVANPMQLEMIQLKVKQTMLERHGVEHPMLSDEIKQRVLASHASRSEEDKQLSKEKARLTSLANYGVEYPMQSEEVKALVAATWKENYPSGHPLREASVLARLRRTNLERYGYESHSGQHLSVETRNKLRDRDWLYDQHVLQKKPYTLIASELGVSPTLPLKWAQQHGIESKRFRCSQGHQEIRNYIQSLGFETLDNDRAIIHPVELDIVVPAKMLAIEFHGLYWHSVMADDYTGWHRDKMLLAEAAGYKLIQIFEDEWYYSADLVKRKIANALGVATNRVYARKCQIVEVSSEDASDFMSANHMQGAGRGRYRYGLTHADELVALMQLRWKGTVLYLDRFATSSNVIGGFSKLLKHAISQLEPEEILTYADLRWSSSLQNVYLTNGFDFEGVTSPGYFYVVGRHRESRIKYQKHKLQRELLYFDEDLTEAENMQENGFFRIFDAGHARFRLKC